MIHLLRDNGFGYLKVDYNAIIGFGVDGAESAGEGLRQYLKGMQKFFRKLRKELPDPVIENCSSGGRRLEPSMMGLCAMGSFSDAHETREIPIIRDGHQPPLLMGVLDHRLTRMMLFFSSKSRLIAVTGLSESAKAMMATRSPVLMR